MVINQAQKGSKELNTISVNNKFKKKLNSIPKISWGKKNSLTKIRIFF